MEGARSHILHALCSLSFLQTVLLDFQLLMGLSIFIAVSLPIFHPQVWVIETAHLHHRGGWGELPLWGPGLAQSCDWSAGAIPGSWLAAGNTGLIRPAAGLTARPNIPKSSCNSNILIFYLSDWQIRIVIKSNWLSLVQFNPTPNMKQYYYYLPVMWCNHTRPFSRVRRELQIWLN